MTALMQSHKLDDILRLYLQNRNVKKVTDTEITSIYSTISPEDVKHYLLEDGMLGSAYNAVTKDIWEITGKAILHLDAGGYKELVRHRNRMEIYVKLATIVSFVSLFVSILATLHK